MPRLKIAQHFVEKAQTVQSRSELLGLLEDATFEMGFRYFALIHHADLRRSSPNIIHFENYPEAWADYFIRNALYADDPVLRASLTANVGFVWADVPKMISITSQQRLILESASKQGMGEGFTVPANIPGECSGSCSFSTRFGRNLPEENLLAAQLIGGFAFQAARRMTENDSMIRPTLPRLTPRQRECLLLAIQGKTDWEIGVILSLSQETVSQHLDMARARYGVTKRLPLAIRALFDGEISFVEAVSWQFPHKRE